MSASEVDHNYHHRRQQQQQDQLQQPPQPPTLLPATTYSHPSRPTHPLDVPPLQRSSSDWNPRPPISHTDNPSISNSHNEPDSLNDSSTDPSDFYRKYRDPFQYDDPSEFVAQAGIRNNRFSDRADDEMITASSPSYLRDSRIPSSTRGTTTPPRSVPRQYRSTSTTSNNDDPPFSPSYSTRPNPAAVVAGSRRTSLKELVNKFNQTPDEIPPLPSRPASRTPSRAVSPSGGAPSSRNRAWTRSASNSTSNQPGTGHRGRSEQNRYPPTTRSSSFCQKPDSSVPNGDPDTIPWSRQPPPTKRSRSSVGAYGIVPDEPPAIPTQAEIPRPLNTSRRPLFGELLPVQTSVPDRGYGISPQRGRRGSEGSISSPNPMFRSQIDSPSALSPSSPTAWYLGYTPSLETVNFDSTTNPHRRSQSDYTQLNPSILSPLNTQLLQMAQIHTSPADPHSACSNETTSARANTSRSRIPVASRRLSQTSDSGNSSPSTRANSALGRHSNQYPTPRKGASALPKPASKPPSPSSAVTTVTATAKITPVKSNSTAAAISRRRDANQPSPLQLDKSPSLKAYISAPPAKKSPQLRSSRPRQPVSSATTSSSRAKVVDRVSSLQSKSNGEPKSPRRSRRLPELGNVDFAARRQRIQQAFNKTVLENEKKEEEDAVERRRLAKETEDQETGEQATTEEESQKFESEVKGESEEQAAITVTVDQNEAQEPFPETDTEFTMEDAPLTLDTTSLAQPNQNAGPDELLTSRRYEVDSPTLGVPDQIADNLGVQRTLTPVIDNHPVSAITVDTVDTMGTDVTTFDPEPQTDPPQNIHRTVLSQIMQMRESSSSESSPTTASSSGEPDISLSERSDKESIQIMFRDSIYYDSMGSSDSQEEQIGPLDDLPADGQNSRWSMCSWSSSIREPQSVDVPLESIREVASPAIGDEAQTQAPVSTEERNNGQTPRPWSPSTASPPPSRSTLDVPFGSQRPSESSPKRRPSSPGSLESYQQQILSKSPDLAKQGGWDSKRVTQLYLQELARGRFEVPFPSDTHRVTAPENNNDATSNSREKEPSQPNGLTEDPVIVPESRALPRSDYVPHRASLNHREDWERASPSIADWMHFVAADDIANSPIMRTGPTPTQKFPVPAPDREGVETPRNAPTEDQPDLPRGGRGEEGLGLSIHVHSPQGEDASPIDTAPPPPPIPNHSPPPPPTAAPAMPTAPAPAVPAAGDTSLHPPVEVSPSIYSSHPPSSVFPSGPPPPPLPNDYSINSSDRSSEESSLQHAGPTPSPQTQGSSATSVDQSSMEQTPAAEPAPRSKGTPSPEQRRLKKRRHVIKELVDTEHVFGRDMKVVDDIYKGTSSSCLDLSSDDVKTLFGNSDQVVQFSMDFLDALKKASKNVYVLPRSQRWQSIRKSKSVRGSSMLDEQTSAAEVDMTEEEKDRTTSIGEVFMTYVGRMEKVYADYLKNHDAANKKLEILQRNQKVSIWLKECREWASDLTTAWDLDSLLVKPVQRILKYPLLLAELRDSTPTDHPDHEALANALREMTSISVRINDSKKRADLVGQVVSSRKRKESDVRAGLSKAFGRRTEKLKQHVGFSEMFEDKDFDALSQTFGDSFFQLQVVMRDVEFYTSEVQSSMNRFNEFILAIEANVDVGPSNYPEMESKWRRFRMAVKEVVVVALHDHIASVRKSVIEPMITLLKLHDGPQKVMQKRNKRLMDYARFKAIKDRGDKPDKKTTEQGEQFVALNVTLKEELPRLFALTAKLMEACLGSFVQIQTNWFSLLQKKLGYAIDRLPDDLNQIVSEWSGDFSFSEAQVLSLGVCNGSMLADAINLVNFNTPETGADMTSPPRTSTLNSSSNPRTTSFDSGASPKISYDLGSTNGSFMTSPAHPAEALQQQRVANSRPNSSHRSLLANRTRTNSAVSGRGSVPHAHAEIVANTQSLQAMTSPRRSNVQLNAPLERPTNHESPSLPRLSLDTPSLGDLMPNTSMGTGNEAENNTATDNQPPSPNSRYTGFFSSAMPMSDSPLPSSPSAGINPAPAPNHTTTAAAAATVPTEDPSAPPQKINVLFIAASMFEFNIDRARREAGYPYLTYVAGEIFDVIAEKGELWLAKNQDDSTNQIGWIWNKHFAKLPSRV